MVHGACTVYSARSTLRGRRRLQLRLHNHASVRHYARLYLSSLKCASSRRVTFQGGDILTKSEDSVSIVSPVMAHFASELCKSWRP